jgi:amino acid transporter
MSDLDSYGLGAMPEIEPRASGLESAARPGTEGRLRRGLSSFGVLLITLSCLSPAFSIYGAGSDVLQHAGSGAAGLFLLGIAVAVIWAVVYAELGAAYPYAGGDYVGVGSILGGWAGVVTLALWAVTAGPSVAFEAEVLSDYMGDLAPGLPAMAMTFGSLAAAVVIALLAVRTSALVTGLFLAVEMALILVLIGAGFWHPARGLGEVVAHPVLLGAGGVLTPVSVAVLALAGVNATYATVGGNQAIYFGEELRDPHRRMGRVVLAACLIGAVATALPVIAVVLGAPDLAAILRTPTPFTAFLSQVAGPWAGHALSVGVVLAIFNAMIAQIMMNARLFFSLGRDELLSGAANRLLAGVHAKSGAPRRATLVAAVFSALCCLLDSHVLLVFISGLLVYAWGLVCLAVLVGRRKGLTGQAGYWRAPFYPAAPVLGLILAVVFTVADLADADAGRPSLVILGLVVMAAVIWSEFVLKRRPGGWKPSLLDTHGQ